MLFEGWFWSIIENMLNYLGFLSFKKITGGLELFVRTKNDERIPIIVQPQWSVKRLKSNILAKMKNLDVDSTLRIIFQGKSLNDDVLISQCDLGNHSILDAVVIKVSPSIPKINTESGRRSEAKPLCDTLQDLQLNDEEKRQYSTNKARFFVYCSDCESLQPGKLRVKCGYCKSGALLVHADPCSWSDVLEPNKIPGSCSNCGDEELVYAQFYFKCGGHSSQEDSSPPLNLVRSNVKLISCLACTDTKDIVIVFECTEQHVICLDCFQQYGLSKLNERGFILDDIVGYTLSCPAKCPNSSVKQTRHFRLLGNSQYERYQKFGAEEFVLSNGGLLCPFPGCGAGILSDESRCRNIKCQECSFVFCKLCLQGYHVSEECTPLQNSESASVLSGTNFVLETLNLNMARWDINSQAIKMISKPCPNCRTPTERSGGCMHMSCTKSGCGFQWCWICQNEWSRDCMADHWFGN